jgi:hypothetical protein
VKVPGGALGIGVGDRVYMLENTWYSVELHLSLALYIVKVGSTKSKLLRFEIDFF